MYLVEVQYRTLTRLISAGFCPVLRIRTYNLVLSPIRKETLGLAFWSRRLSRLTARAPVEIAAEVIGTAITGGGSGMVGNMWSPPKCCATTVLKKIGRFKLIGQFVML